MVEKERRQTSEHAPSALESNLNNEQKMTLQHLEGFGWELKFVRRPLFQTPIPVVFDGERRRYAVLEEDGSLNENPDFDIRH